MSTEFGVPPAVRPIVIFMVASEPVALVAARVWGSPACWPVTGARPLGWVRPGWWGAAAHVKL
jgi:hypothetical protein